MSEKIKKIVKYVLYALTSNVIYGLLLFFVFTRLAGYSLLYAYLGNLALIIIGLIFILIVSKTIEFNPDLLNGDLSNYIFANS